MAIDDFRNLALVEVERIHRLAYAMTLNAEAAEKLVREAYNEAFNNLPKALPDRDVRCWLMGTMFRLYSVQQASTADPATRKCPGTPEPASVESRPFRISDGPPGWLEEALPGMSFRCRAVIVLWAVEALTYREIADVMGEPVGTITVWLNRAQNYLIRKRGDAATRLDSTEPK